MSVTEFFSCPRVRRRMYAGPLGPYVDAFTERLQQQGYSTRSIRSKIRAVANFSLWLAIHDHGAHEVDGLLRVSKISEGIRWDFDQVQ